MNPNDIMNRSSSRKVKLTSKFEEFKLTANGKKRGRPRKSWPQDDSRSVQPTQVATKQSTIPQMPREESLRPREENNHAITTPAPASTPKPHVTRPMSSKREELLRLREENITLKNQLEQMRIEYDELKRQSSYTGQTVPKIDYDDLRERYQRDLTAAKRRHWCTVCLAPGRLYCCWQTVYCSQRCQVGDWYSKHGKVCARTKARMVKS